MRRETAKSVISLLFAFLPILFLSCSNANSIENYRELLLATSIPGFLYFIRYQIVKPIVRDEMIKPLAKILGLCTRALSGEKEALDKLIILEEKIVKD